MASITRELIGSEYTPGLLTAPATSTVTCATDSVTNNSGGASATSYEVPRTTRNIERAITSADIESKDRFCDTEKVIWLHQD